MRISLCWRVACRPCATLFLLLSFTACQVPGRPADAVGLAGEEGHGLLPLMTTNAHLLHKLALSVRARNGPLADFYAYELEETLEEVIANVPEYEGMPVGQLTRDIMLPFMTIVRESLDARNWEEADRAVDTIVRACNQCHARTDHEYIQVTSGADRNPFNQSFEPQPDAGP